MIRLYLLVTRGAMFASQSRLWFYDVATDYPLRKDDEVFILVGDDGSFEVEWDVGRVYVNLDGSVHAELVPARLDPDEQAELQCRNGSARAWWTSRDGDLNAMLAASGWQEQ